MKFKLFLIFSFSMASASSAIAGDSVVNVIRTEDEPLTESSPEFFKTGKIIKNEKSLVISEDKNFIKTEDRDPALVVNDNKNKQQKSAVDKQKKSISDAGSEKVTSEPQAVFASTSAPVSSRTQPISTGYPGIAPIVGGEARFNMEQDGKKMTADDFSKWMEANGIRIVPAKPKP